MPILRKEVEDKIIELLDQGYKNVEISEKTGVHRKTVANRRKKHEKRKPDHQKPETEEEIIQQEQPESTQFDLQIYTLMREQGTHSKEEAISQAILTQHSFNPYILNHGLRTASELVSFFEEEIRQKDERIKLIAANADRYLDRVIALSRARAQ